MSGQNVEVDPVIRHVRPGGQRGRPVRALLLRRGALDRDDPARTTYQHYVNVSPLKTNMGVKIIICLEFVTISGSQAPGRCKEVIASLIQLPPGKGLLNRSKGFAHSKRIWLSMKQRSTQTTCNDTVCP